MASLSADLQKLPPQALELLRYLGRNQVDSGDENALAIGADMTRRSIGKAIRRLVTNNYMFMDDARVYFLTQKGKQAIADLATYDAASPQPAQTGPATIAYDLCAVIPGQLTPKQPNECQIGLSPDNSEAVEKDTQILLRFHVTGGQIATRNAVLDLSSSTSMPFTSVKITPQTDEVRVRVEAFRMMGMDALEEAGGMYFDVTTGADNQPVAFHTPVDIIR